MSNPEANPNSGEGLTDEQLGALFEAATSARNEVAEASEALSDKEAAIVERWWEEQ